MVPDRPGLGGVCLSQWDPGRADVRPGGRSMGVPGGPMCARGVWVSGVPGGLTCAWGVSGSTVVPGGGGRSVGNPGGCPGWADMHRGGPGQAGTHQEGLMPRESRAGWCMPGGNWINGGLGGAE